MIFKISVVTLVITLAAIGAFFAFKNLPGKEANISSGPIPETLEKPKLPARPWLEVIRPKIFKSDNQNQSRIELNTGDELQDGDVLEADRRGLAIAHFPDGSVLRVDSESKFTLEETSFDPQSEKLTAKIKLASGRLWSKVLALATPDSLWEVKTTNAVATVRGTAFGFESLSGRSRILGSEETVTVGALDPTTGEAVKDAEVKIAANKFVEIKDEDIKKFIQKPKLLAVRDAPAEILSQDWVRRYKAEDETYNRKIEELRRESNLEGRELRELFRQSIYEQFKNELTPRESTPAEGEKANGNETGAAIKSRGGSNEALPQTERGVQNRSGSEARSLEIITRNNLDQVTDGDELAFEAVLTLDGGRRQNVTADAAWRVLGPAGRIIRPGVFQAKLDDSVSELGQAPGTIIATWRDKETGENLIGRSAVFNVRARVEKNIEREG